jgi:CRISPR-associated protein Cas2
MTNYFLSYDISEDALRTKIARILEQKGCRRVQKSVFFLPRFSRKELSALRAEIKEALKTGRSEQDSIICIPTKQEILKQLVWEGDAQFFETAVKEVLVTFI